MNVTPDILIIGGGIAGLSAAAALAQHARVTVLEAEAAIGVHSSGRSATMLHYALGDPLIRALTLASRRLFDAPPPEFGEVARTMPLLVHARADELDALDALDTAIAPFATLDRLDAAGVAALCPLLRVGDGAAIAGLADRNALRLDPNALLQGYLHQLKARAGTLHTDTRIAQIERRGSNWEVFSERGERFAASILVNAAGAWGDSVARMAGVRPLGLAPLRRTIITFDAPAGTDLTRLPFAKTVGDDLYFAPESGRLFASPMDEVPDEPGDAQPDEYEVALAAHRMEQRTTVRIERIQHRWAGLRTFAPDRRPVGGFAPDAPGFFWLVGQGGSGLQTSPAMAAVAGSLIAGTPWPDNGVAAAALSPDRFA